MALSDRDVRADRYAFHHEGPHPQRGGGGGGPGVAPESRPPVLRHRSPAGAQDRKGLGAPAQRRSGVQAPGAEDRPAATVADAAQQLVLIAGDVATAEAM